MRRGLTTSRAASNKPLDSLATQEVDKSFLEQTPLREYASHQEIAKAALFLASSDSSHTTGEALNVSGGRLMN